jgi:hypothetical protein
MDHFDRNTKYFILWYNGLASIAKDRSQPQIESGVLFG